MKIAFFMFAILAGVMSALESGSNNTLQKRLDTPWWAIVIVAGVTLTAALIATIAVGERLPTARTMGDVPWYGWIGGLFALVFVADTVFASPKLGAGTFVAIVVTASTLTSLVLDNYALMGFELHTINTGRIVGAVAMIVGVVLIAIF